MIYTTQARTIQACHYGIDEVPAWLRPYLTPGPRQKGDWSNKYATLQQIESDPRMIGEQRVPVGHYVLREEDGAFLTLSPEQFFRYLITRTSEPLDV